MDDAIHIKIKDVVNSSLEMNSAASTFFEEVNNLSGDNINVDFKEVVFMSRSFAQEYIKQKNKTKKTIHEVNLSEEVLPLFQIVERSFKSSHI